MLGISVEELDPELVPEQIVSKGNYAVSILWSDIHDKSIYTFADIKRVAQEIEKEKLEEEK